MNTDYTHISMIIDRSGSMSNVWNDVVGGYKQIVSDNKAEKGKCTFTVAAFDTEYDLIEDFTDIQKVDENLKVQPRGGTSLLDAIGKTIVSVGEKLAKLKEEDRPSKVIVMIQTDGQENSSREFNREAIKKLITEHTEKYSWTFQFLGADINSVNDAVSYGINVLNTAVYNTHKTGATFGLFAEKSKMMRSASPEMYAATCAFTEDEKDSIK